MTTQRRRLTEPLGSVTALFGGVLLFALAAGIVSSLVARGIRLGADMDDEIQGTV
jgi:hypothetical protein